MPRTATIARTSSARSDEVSMTSRTTSSTRRATTVPSTGSFPAFEFTERTSSNSDASSASGLSFGSSCGPSSSWARSEVRRNQLLNSGRQLGLLGALTTAGALEVRLRALDLALERGDGLRHRVDGLRAERVDRVHRLEHVVERLLQLLDVDGAARSLLVDLGPLDAQLVRRRLDQVGRG